MSLEKWFAGLISGIGIGLLIAAAVILLSGCSILYGKYCGQPVKPKDLKPVHRVETNLGH